MKDTYKWLQQNGAAAVCRRARQFQDVQGAIAALSLSSAVGMNATAVHVRSFRMSGSEEEFRINVQSLKKQFSFSQTLQKNVGRKSEEMWCFSESLSKSQVLSVRSGPSHKPQATCSLLHMLCSSVQVRTGSAL